MKEAGEHTVDERKGGESRERRRTPRTITGLINWAVLGTFETAGSKRTMGRSQTSGLSVIKAINTEYSFKQSSYESSSSPGWYISGRGTKGSFVGISFFVLSCLKDNKDFSMFADKEENMPLEKEESVMMHCGGKEHALSTTVTEQVSREGGGLQERGRVLRAPVGFPWTAG